jgi:hypothetical protein
LLYGLMAVISGTAIAYIAFIQVTLTKAFEMADPWDTVKVFAIVTGLLVIAYRAMGLHRPF